jgi:HEAT repeats
MKKRLLVIATGVLVVGILVGLTPTSRCIVLGLWRGERFYSWRPTSYWSRYLQDSRNISAWTARGSGFGAPLPWWSELVRKAEAWWRDVRSGSIEEKENDFSGQLYTDSPTWIRAFGNDPAAIPVLLELLETGPPSVRTDAVWALVEIRPPSEEKMVHALIQALDDRNCFVRSNAMVAIGRMGPAAREAVPALVRLWERAEYLAGDALQKIDPETAKYTHPLVWTEE